MNNHLYVFHNPNYSGGQFKDFITFSASNLENAEERIVPYQGVFSKTRYKLFSIVKGIRLQDFNMPTK